MKPVLLFAALIALNIGVTVARAEEGDATGTPNDEVSAASLVTLNATVTAIDQATREVTLTDAEGNSHVITAGKTVKNLAQVEVGDQLDVAYYESITFKKLAPGEAAAQAAAESAVATAEPGDKPAAVAKNELAFVATVEAVDKPAKKIELKGPLGNTRTIQIKDPANLEKLAVGDELLITVTKAVAVVVSEAPGEN